MLSPFSCFFLALADLYFSPFIDISISLLWGWGRRADGVKTDFIPVHDVLQLEQVLVLGLVGHSPSFLGFGIGEPTSTVGVAVSDWVVVADSESAPPVTAPLPVEEISSCANSVVTDTSQNAKQLGIEALARIFG
jgi:hypothetical protein